MMCSFGVNLAAFGGRNPSQSDPRVADTAGRLASLGRLGRRAAAGALILAWSAAQVGAQGCAMCYQNAAASGEAGRAALRHGILILLLPAISLFAGMFALSYSRRDPAPLTPNQE